MSRIDKFTSSKKPIIYSDFLDNLDTNPVTGLLARRTNEDSIKSSLKRMILTYKGEKDYAPLYGTSISGTLFEFNDDITMVRLEDEIRETINNCEPRVSLQDVVIDSTGNNDITITIYFYIINIPQLYEYTFIVKRIR
jgi:phage baseplate assembly protein W